MEQSYEVRFRKHVLSFLELFESSVHDLLSEDFLTRTNVTHDPIGAYSFDAMIVDQHDLSVRLERLIG